MTKMTLTQVSTWFANARRRLKKENKMTWSPRNRCGDKKEGGEDDDPVSDSDGEHSGSEEDKLCDDKDENITNIKGIAWKTNLLLTPRFQIYQLRNIVRDYGKVLLLNSYIFKSV